MRPGNPNIENNGRRNLLRYGLILLLLVIAVIGGVKTGDWISDRRVEADKQRHDDEYLGLGERTGMTGDLALQVNSTSISVPSGKPITVDLTLVNRGKKPLVLNSWLTPAPAFFASNQLPIKVEVTRAGRRVRFQGNALLLPPHSKNDFFNLRPGEQKAIRVSLPRVNRIGKWDLSAPGVYVVEMWYETYLTGRFVGVNAWTGMTNHVVVKVSVIR